MIQKEKIYQDFLTDLEIQRGSSTVQGSKIMEDIVNEAVDDYTKRTNTIPTPLYQGAYRITHSLKRGLKHLLFKIFTSHKVKQSLIKICC